MVDEKLAADGMAGYRAFATCLDDITGNAEFVELGRRVVEEQTYCFSGFEPAKVDLLGDWSANPFLARGWQWHAASLNFIPWVIAYYASVGPDAVPRFALDAVRSWCAAAATTLRDYEFVEHDHAVAVRAENVLLLSAFLALGCGCTEERRELEQVVDDLSRLLENDAFYARHTNHGIEQSRVLATAAYALEANPASARRWAIAMERLADELAFAFTREGVHVENSPGYHDYVCNAFLKVARFFPPGLIGELQRDIDLLMPKAMRYLAHVVRPDGRLPLIGDTQSRSVHSCFDAYAHRKEWAWLEYAVSRGKRGKPPPETVASYPNSGYMIVRDAWKGAAAAHLVMKCGFRSRYHRHDDDMNLVLFYGEDWLVDGGGYSYEESSPIRRYLRSKWAHNVPVIQHRGGTRWGAPSSRSSGSALRSTVNPDGSVLVQARTGAYAGHRASRCLEVASNRRSFVVHDRIEPVAPREAALFRSLWHVPDDKDIYRRGQDLLVSSRKSKRALRISNLGERFGSVSEFIPVIDGKPGGVMSLRTNQLVGTRIISFNRRAPSFDCRLRFEILDRADINGWTEV